VTPQEMVRQFHERFGQYIGPRPDAHTVAARDASLRTDLHREEMRELESAMKARDIVEIADALGDLVYVLYGHATTYGVDPDAVIAEIHRTNMAKIWPCGHPHYQPNGKPIKPPGWEPPRIKEVLGVMHHEPPKTIEAPAEVTRRVLCDMCGSTTRTRCGRLGCV
jgi:predicted HAD superfamily Cof-like phosphohydrolase